MSICFGCTDGDRSVFAVPPIVADASGGASSSGTETVAGAASGTGVARPGNGGDTNVGAGGADSDDAGGLARDGSVDARPDSGGRIFVTLDPSSIEIFGLPIGSTRYAAAGFDPDTRICASIMWDYSNNDLEVARHCGDFLAYPDFPYVLVRPDQAEPCAYFWDYGGLLPTSASGCIDPIEELVNAQVEVEADGIQYVIRATNDPSR